MSRYDFVPVQHTAGRADQPYCYWEKGFTEEQLNAIEAFGDSLTLQPATVGRNEKPSAKMRKTNVGWIPFSEQTVDFYNTLAAIVQRTNAAFYNFDLTGFVEDFQYGVYDGKQKAHYDWHVDQGAATYSPRKLSISVLLSDPKKYAGGDLQLMTVAGSPTTVKDKARGTVIAFPSYALHRVTPVTRGVRKSIVAWVSGPPFR